MLNKGNILNVQSGGSPGPGLKNTTLISIKCDFTLVFGQNEVLEGNIMLRSTAMVS